MTANRHPGRLRIIELVADTEHLGAIEARYPDYWRSIESLLTLEVKALHVSGGRLLYT